MAESPMAVGAAMAPHHNAAVYAQRALPVALFHAPLPPAPRSERAKLRRSASCLRKISAYNGGFRIADDEEDAAGGVHEARAARFAKKRLSFADQHGGQLVLEKEFHARDAPIYCNNAITYSLPSLYADQEDPSGWRTGSHSVVERLLRGTLRTGGRGGGEQKSGWTQPELLSLCVLSCSVVGCVVFGYARAVQSK